MSRNIGLSITGKQNNSLLTLKGNLLNESNINLPIEVKNLQIAIMNIIIIPYMTQQWLKLNENMLLVENLKNRIDFYLKVYKNNDYLLLYKELLSAFEIIITQNIEINNLEKKILYDDKNNISSLVFKTTLIKLKPEYEIYNLVVGKPESSNKYNKIIIDDIVKLLQLDNITFDTIKNHIVNKYLK
jgi:hypothetical protein